MSLTKQDLRDIRDVVLEALDVAMNPRLDHLEERMDNQESAQQETNRRLFSVENQVNRLDGKVTALHNDVVELYTMVGGLQHQTT